MPLLCALKIAKMINFMLCIYFTTQKKCWQSKSFQKCSKQMHSFPLLLCTTLRTPPPRPHSVIHSKLSGWRVGQREFSFPLPVLCTQVRRLNNWPIGLGNTEGYHELRGPTSCSSERGPRASGRSKEWDVWWNDVICTVNTQKGNIDVLASEVAWIFVFKDSRGNCLWMKYLFLFLWGEVWVLLSSLAI